MASSSPCNRPDCHAVEIDEGNATLQRSRSDDGVSARSERQISCRVRNGPDHRARTRRGFGRIDDDEIRTGNAMILDPYGRILAESTKADDAMAVADLEGTLLHHATGRMWIAARQPELYGLLTQRTGLERDVHELKFEE